CHGIPEHQVTPLNLVDSSATLVLQPAAILRHRFVQDGGRTLEQWLVRWAGLSPDEATWESKDQLCRNFPNLNLEDKVQFRDGSNVMSTDLSAVFVEPVSGPNGDIAQEAEAFVEEVQAPDPTSSRKSKRVRGPPRWLDDFVVQL
ncbi:hypothetical protein Tsubulata_026037, partial [Turnera subulata]